jgi:hypothetical protein
MPHPNHKKGPVKSHGPQPEKGAGPEKEFVGRLKLDLFILQQGAKEKDFKSQSLHHTSWCERAVNVIRFYPGKRFLLSRDRRNMEWNRRACPFQHPVDKPDEEEKNGRIRDEDGKQSVQAHPACSNDDEKKKYKNP